MIKWAAAVLFILSVVIVHTVYSKTLPSFLTPCKRKDPSPNVNKCFLTFMKTLLKRAPKGIPELNIPPIEPFIIPQIVLKQGSSRAVSLEATLKNIAIHGMSNTDLKAARIRMTSAPIFQLVFSIPKIKLVSNYVIDGKLLIVPVMGAGKNNANLTDVTGMVRLHTKLVNKKGRTHLSIAKRNVVVNVKMGKFYFDNLFNGNKQLGDTTNQFINENWQELYNELRPVIADAIGGIVEYVVKIVLDEYTFDEIFPEK